MKLVIMAPYMFALGPGVNQSLEAGVILGWSEAQTRKALAEGGAGISVS